MLGIKKEMRQIEQQMEDLLGEEGWKNKTSLVFENVLKSWLE